MENDMNIIELDEMKRQLSELKAKLDKETIVNDQLMRRAMKTKVSTINRDAFILIIVALIGIPYCTWVFYALLHISWWFIITTTVFFLVAAFYTYYSRKDIKANDLMEGDLLEVRQKMVRMNKMNANWLKFSLPFLFVWFAWFIFETIGNSNEAKEILTGAVVGLIIGLTIGILQYRKTQRIANEVIGQINDLKEGK